MGNRLRGSKNDKPPGNNVEQSPVHKSPETGTIGSSSTAPSADGAEQGTSSSTVSADQGTSSSTVIADQGTSSSTVIADQGTSSSTVIADQGTSSSTVSADQGTSSSTVSVDLGTSSSTVIADQGTSALFRGGNPHLTTQPVRHAAGSGRRPDHESSSMGPKMSDDVISQSFIELEEIYSNVKLRKEVTSKKLRPEQIQLEDIKLNAGDFINGFGSMMKGTCRLAIREIPVAVKVVNYTDLDPEAQREIINEVDAMKTLDHPHIVRLIGMCEGDPMMIVVELAELGSLNKFLPKNKHLPLWNILELMWQVAQGMAYLEKDRIVHRDLAARNVLLCDQHFIKITGLYLCKAAFNEDNCYEAYDAGRWPLKWYDMYCINYWKFDSKSDVWSFGVTLWEATSYGAKPYYKMTGLEMVHFLNEGNRLAKPISCTDEAYEVMRSREDRPTFKQLVPIMEELYLSHRQADI